MRSTRFVRGRLGLQAKHPPCQWLSGESLIVSFRENCPCVVESVFRFCDFASDGPGSTMGGDGARKLFF